MLPNIIEIWSKMTSKSIQKGSNIAPRGGAKSLQGVPPRRFREPGRQKDRPPREILLQMVPLWDPKIDMVVHFGVICSIFVRFDLLIDFGIDLLMILEPFGGPILMIA